MPLFPCGPSGPARIPAIPAYVAAPAGLRAFCVPAAISRIFVLIRSILIAMAPKVDRRRRAAPSMSEWAWAQDWFDRLPEGPCKLAVARFREERGREGASPEEALTQSLAYAQQHFPEEVALWTLDRGVVPDPWHNESVQRGIRCSLLALRELREERARAEAILEEVRALAAQQAAALVPFTGTGHHLGEGDLTRLD